MSWLDDVESLMHSLTVREVLEIHNPPIKALDIWAKLYGACFDLNEI